MAQGLFASPEQIRFLEAQQRARATGLPYNQQGLFELGRGIGNTFRQIGGQDTRSLAERRSQQVNELMQGMDLTNRADMIGRVKELANQGLLEESIAAAKLIPAKTAGPLQERLVNVGGKQYLHSFQRQPDNTYKEVFKLAGPDPETGSGLPNRPFLKPKDFEMTDALRQSYTEKLNTAYPATFGSFDVEDTQQMLTDVSQLANDMHVEHINALNAGIPHRLGPGPLTRDLYLQQAFDAFIQGPVQDYISPSRVGADNISTPVDTPTVSSATQSIIDARTRSKAQAKFAGSLVHGDPRTTQWNLFKHMSDNNQAGQALLAGTPDAISKSIQAQGFDVTPEIYQSHLPFWDAISNERGVAKKFLGTPSLWSAEQELEVLASNAAKNGNIPRSVDLLRMKEYLAMFHPAGGKKKRNRDRSRGPR